jgi:hypothetical protein
METGQPLYTLSVSEAESLIKNWIKQCLDETKLENPASSLPKYRTRKEVTKIFKMSLPTLDKYSKLGLIKSKRIGNRVLYSEDDIQIALKECPVKYSRK